MKTIIKNPAFLVIIFIFAMTTACNQQNPVKAQTSDETNDVNTSQNLKNKESAQPTPRQISKPEIISRESWKAKKPVGKGKTHTIKFITIHHSASNQKPTRPIEQKLRNLQNFSQSRAKLASGKTKPAWFDVPYHYYIAPDGKIAEARQIEFAGDTNTSYDPTGHALIVLEGNFEIEEPTAEQIAAMKLLTAWLADKYEVNIDNIKAHNDYTSTACPGKNLKTLMPDLRESLLPKETLTETKTESNKHPDINKLK
jgi:hypothetical protein